MSDSAKHGASWFPVLNRNGSRSIFNACPDALPAFHAISNTGSLSAIDTVSRHYSDRLGHPQDPNIRGVFENAPDPAVDTILEAFPHSRAYHDPATGKVSFAASHNIFGIHEFITRPVVYCTILRDPCLTYISREFFFCCCAGAGGNPDAKFDLEAIIDADTRDNLVVRDLAQPFAHLGICRVAPLAGLHPPLAAGDALNAAGANINNHFVFVGITEQFAESVFLLADILGIPAIPMWTRQMATPGRPALSDFPERVIRKLRTRIEADLELYEAARSNFESIIAECDYGPELEEYKRQSPA